MESKKLIYLFNKFTSGKATLKEIIELDSALNEDKNELSAKKIIEDEWDGIRTDEFAHIIINDSKKIYNGIISQPQHKIIRRKLWLQVAAASLILLVCGYAILHFQGRNDLVKTGPSANILPGKNGATLKLSSGKIINLTQSAGPEIVKDSGVSISRKDDGQLVYQMEQADEYKQINVLSTANGQVFKLVLPDGSMVWLNAASSLTYNTTLLEGGLRNVKLVGEGYFEIAKDKKHPFVVESKGQKVTVLGTHFNIRSYQEDMSIRTTLLEGAVNVSSTSGNCMLKPGQQSIFREGKIIVSTVNPEQSIAWKNGFFEYENDDLNTIVGDLKRWYNIEADMDNIPAIKFSGIIPRTKKLSEVFKIFKITSDINMQIREGRLEVTK
ncbi:FecR family protein [Pedobacter sp. MC2016-24]|uniref:FecR family protein n=1 Tax=Pedobacter sp. MC2016-24 TaxID=2780090 RepID=UPI00187FBCDB|nr:FecR family protein [Pedobacter sp. MC2016-24]MBE9601571.1 FecR domain-containing protein [Pedobacter sp. MC2016-24]